MSTIDLFFLLSIFVAAFLYSSVGHGGASGYLTIMAMYAVAPGYMKSSALTLNLVVSALAFWHYYRNRHFDWKLFLAFSVHSVPMSFVGSLFSISDTLYKKILGICLLIAVVRLLGWVKQKEKINATLSATSTLLALLIGAIIGLISGMIGIGGGILLTPILLLLGWTHLRTAAGISALFIFVNSLSGLAGLHFSGAVRYHPSFELMLLSAFAGGFVGSYAGSYKLDAAYLRYILALVLVVASLKLIFA